MITESIFRATKIKNELTGIRNIHYAMSKFKKNKSEFNQVDFQIDLIEEQIIILVEMANKIDG